MSGDFAFQKSMRTPHRKLEENDPIWGTTANVQLSQQGVWLVDSARGGKYLCDSSFGSFISHWNAADKAKLSTYITDQERMNVYYPDMHSQLAIAIADTKPLGFSEKIDRFFMYLSRRGYRVGTSIIPSSPVLTTGIQETRQIIMRWIEAIDETELHGLMGALTSDGLLEFSGNTHRLSAKGMMRLDAINQRSNVNDQAFVAMWFGEEMSTAYTEGIALGLADAGYSAFRIDQSEHSNKIDDEIIAEIRRSRFVVADFTCGSVGEGADKAFVPRGGVYYEAGFAQGLGMPVIWMVRQDQIDAVHFDTRQFNHIVWSTPKDLRERLARRVLAVVGAPNDDRTIIRA